MTKFTLHGINLKNSREYQAFDLVRNGQVIHCDSQPKIRQYQNASRQEIFELMKEAEKGNHQAQYDLAVIYRFGLGKPAVGINNHKFLELLDKAVIGRNEDAIKEWRNITHGMRARLKEDGLVTVETKLANLTRYNQERSRGKKHPSHLSAAISFDCDYIRSQRLENDPDISNTFADFLFEHTYQTRFSEVVVNKYHFYDGQSILPLLKPARIVSYLNFVRSDKISLTIADDHHRGQFIDDDEIRYFFFALNRNRRINSLTFKNKDPHYKKTFFDNLGENITLRTLDLSESNVGSDDVQSLAEALLKNNFLVNLNLRRNNLQDEGATTLARVLEQNKTLRSLNLFNNQLTERGMSEIAVALTRNTTLKELHLGGQNDYFTEEAIENFAQAVSKNSTLETLSLRGTFFSNVAPEFAKVLKTNQSLKSLDIQWSDINDQGIEALAEAFMNHNLTLKNLAIDFGREDEWPVWPETQKTLVTAIFVTNEIRKALGKDLLTLTLPDYSHSRLPKLTEEEKAALKNGIIAQRLAIERDRIPTNSLSTADLTQTRVEINLENLHLT